MTKIIQDRIREDTYTEKLEKKLAKTEKQRDKLLIAAKNVIEWVESEIESKGKYGVFAKLKQAIK